MVDSIKITALQDIGANIAYTTLVPLVNMAGTPTTQKANLQNLGNLVLNGAGGSYFAPAARAILAQSVTNAAQPNITSVGTLTSLAVTGNITAGNINGGNIVVANFYYGDGGFLTNVSSGYSNSNVAVYLPTYTGNVGAGNVNVTGTVYANGLSSTGLASLTTLNVSTTANLGAVGNVLISGGSNGQVLTTNGNSGLSWTTVSGGNIGSELVNGDNSFVLDVDGNVVFEGTPAGNAVNRGLVWDYGANANGVNSTLRQDNAGLTVRAWTEDAGNYAASVNIVTNQDANTKTWEFDGNGNLTLPGNLIVPEGNIESAITSLAFSSAITGITTGNATVIVTLADPVFGDPFQGEVTISSVTGTTEANGVWGYQATDPNEFQLYTDATITTPVDGTTWTAYISGGNAVGVSTYTDFTIQGGNVSIGSNENTWVFGADGNLVLADGNSVIQSIANSSLDPVLPNVSTMVLTPDSGYNTQALVLDPTAPGHIHLRSPGANIDEPYSNIFLGGETSSFEVGYHNGAAPNLFIHSGNNTWTFSNDGRLTFPGTPRIDTDADNFEVQAAEAISLEANTVVNVYTDAGNTTYQWQFGDDGNLTLPGNTVAINFANGSAAFGNIVAWTAAPIANTSAGTAGQAAYDSGGNLYVCVATNTWSKFSGTTSW